MTKAEFLIFARLVVLVTFGLAAASKARDRDGFHKTIRDFKLASDARARVLVPLVILAETAIAVLVVSPDAAAVVGFSLACAILALYTGILGVARLKGSTVGCNCFGRSPTELSWSDVGRNILLLAIAGGGLWSALDRAAAPPAQVAGLFAAAGVAAVVVLVNLDAVVTTLRRPILVEEAQ